MIEMIKYGSCAVGKQKNPSAWRLVLDRGIDRRFGLSVPSSPHGDPHLAPDPRCVIALTHNAFLLTVTCAGMVFMKYNICRYL